MMPRPGEGRRPEHALVTLTDLCCLWFGDRPSPWLLWPSASFLHDRGGSREEIVQARPPCSPLLPPGNTGHLVWGVLATWTLSSPTPTCPYVPVHHSAFPWWEGRLFIVTRHAGPCPLPGADVEDPCDSSGVPLGTVVCHPVPSLLRRPWHCLHLRPPSVGKKDY